MRVVMSLMYRSGTDKIGKYSSKSKCAPPCCSVSGLCPCRTRSARPALLVTKRALLHPARTATSVALVGPGKGNVKIMKSKEGTAMAGMAYDCVRTRANGDHGASGVVHLVSHRGGQGSPCAFRADFRKPRDIFV